MKLPSAPPPTGYGRALRTLRAYRGMGQRELAAKAGFSWAVISKWEMGKAGIIQPHREVLAAALRVPYDVFCALARRGDPLVATMSGFYEMPEPKAYYSYPDVAEALECSINLVRLAVRLGVATPTREFRRVWFTAEDVEKIRAWRRARAADVRSRIASKQARKQPHDRHRLLPLPRLEAGDRVPHEGREEERPVL